MTEDPITAADRDEGERSPRRDDTWGSTDLEAAGLPDTADPDSMADGGPRPLDPPTIPAEAPVGMDHTGQLEAEPNRGESLTARLEQEEPDVSAAPVVPPDVAPRLDEEIEPTHRPGPSAEEQAMQDRPSYDLPTEEMPAIDDDYP